MQPLPIGDSLADTDADAVLLIGDRAMHSPGGRFDVVWDLGDEWCRWTGLPFVFAMWVARPASSWTGWTRPWPPRATRAWRIWTRSPRARRRRWA